MSEVKIAGYDSFLSRWVFAWILVFLSALSFSSALMEISVSCALGGWLLSWIRKPCAFPLGRKATISVFSFVFICAISFFWSDFPKQSFRGIFKVLKEIALFWIVATTLTDRRRQDLALKTLLGVFLVLSFDGIWQYIFGADLFRGIPLEAASSGPRVSASFKNYGLMASFLVSFLPLLYAGLQYKKWDRRHCLKGLAVAGGALLLFWSRARGAWIALLAGLAIFLWMKGKQTTVAFLILGTLVGLFLLPRHLVLHLDQWGKEQSLIERVYLWDRAVKVIEARPWTGTGINTYAVAHQQFDQKQNWRVRNYYAHNGYLQIAAETGIPSLLCFLAFLFFYFREAIRTLTRDARCKEATCLSGVISGLASFLLFGMIDTIFHNLQAVMGFWFLLGWGSALISSLKGRTGANATVPVSGPKKESLS